MAWKIGFKAFASALLLAIGSGVVHSQSLHISQGYESGTGATGSTMVFAFATAAPNGWMCHGIDKTNPGPNVELFVPLSSTQVQVPNYTRTTGAIANWPSGDQLLVSCDGG